jgi:predicted CXXCH cytochrome family protein
MRRSPLSASEMRKVLPALAALLLLCSPALAKGPHERLSDPEYCKECHVTEEGSDAPGKPAALNADVISLCLKCHDRKMVFGTHPVEIRPEMKLPEGIHLSEEGTMTCATCHDPHMESESETPYVAESFFLRLRNLFTPGKTHRTYFLRLPNDEGQLCKLCHDMKTLGARSPLWEVLRFEEFTGSKNCEKCHAEIYGEWKKTPHARMVRDPREEPSAVAGDFSKDPPLPLRSVSFVLGSHWRQQYVEEVDGELYVKGKGWNMKAAGWETMAWEDKPWSLSCQGCHTTGFVMEDKPRYAEAGIGCEACHGPGRSHAESGGSSPIVNPARLTTERREMICQACHTTGHDVSGQFQFPLGYLPGQDLSFYFKGLMPKSGQSDDSFYGDGSYEDRRRQFEWWKTTVLEARGVACSACNDFRSRGKKEVKPLMSIPEYCRSCHKDYPGKAAVHKKHQKPGVDCTSCHMAAVAKSTGGYSVHDHKFLFSPPPGRKIEKPSETCDNCHKVSPANLGVR